MYKSVASAFFLILSVISVALTPSPTDNPDVIHATEDNCSPVLVCNFTTYIRSHSVQLGGNFPVWSKNGMSETSLEESSPVNNAISKLKINVTSSASYTCIIYVSDVNGQTSSVESHAYMVYPFVPNITNVNVSRLDTTNVTVTWDDNGAVPCSFCTYMTIVNISLVGGNWMNSSEIEYSERSAFVDDLMANMNYTVKLWNVGTCDGQTFSSDVETIEFKTWSNAMERKPDAPTGQGPNIGLIVGFVVTVGVIIIIAVTLRPITILVVYIYRICWQSFKKKQKTKGSRVSGAPEGPLEAPHVSGAPEGPLEVPCVSGAREGPLEDPPVSGAPEGTLEDPCVSRVPEGPLEVPRVSGVPEGPLEVPRVSGVPEGPLEDPRVSGAQEGPLEVPPVSGAPEGPLEDPCVSRVPEGPLEVPRVSGVPEGPLEVPRVSGVPEGPLEVPRVSGVPEGPLEVPRVSGAPEGPLEDPHVSGAPEGPHVSETQEQGQLLSDLRTPETATGDNSASTEQYSPKKTVLNVPPLKPNHLGEERETQQSFSTRPLNSIPSDKQREEESLHTPQPNKRNNTARYFVSEQSPHVPTDEQPECSSVSMDETPSGTAEQFVSGTEPDF